MFKVSRAYVQATMYLVVGDGSDGRHMCLKYHGHYQAINCLRR